MDKREALLSLLNDSKEQKYIPAGFFIHFDKIYQKGQPAIDRHLEFFRFTEMDFVKVQYENKFPQTGEIKNPGDWAKISLYKKKFYEDQLNILNGLIKAAKNEALVIMTLYSAFMCAGHASGGLATDHLKEDPEKVKKGMEIITESLMIFVKEAISLGVDGFYMSTQGRESHRFSDKTLFDKYIRPFDLVLMKEISKSCIFNILHVCDYHGIYDDLTPFLDYPGNVVNCGLKLKSGQIAAKEVAKMFGRPFMGGVDRLGAIASGTENEVSKMVGAIIKDAPERFILGADCTLPGDINWNNIKKAIQTAHAYK